MSWTDERVELLKRLWSEGLSASQIADQLGGITRNAVIGKVHRLKLESRARVVPVVVQEQPVRAVVEQVAEVKSAPRLVASAPADHAPVAQTVARAAVPQSVGATALKFDVEELPDVDAEPTRAGGEVVPISRKLSLVQLNEQTCKWPLGDPLKPDFHFCGNRAGGASPYCEYHSRLAFQQVERRRIR